MNNTTVYRGLQIGSVWCRLCQESVENTQHPFSSCKVAQIVWDQCERWVGNVTVRHEDIICHFQSFHLLGQSNTVNREWKGMWVTIVSEIWNYRNKVVFKGEVMDVDEIFTLAQLKDWLWMKHKVMRITFSYLDWHFSPVKCLQSLS